MAALALNRREKYIKSPFILLLLLSLFMYKYEKRLCSERKSFSSMTHSITCMFSSSSSSSSYSRVYPWCKDTVRAHNVMTCGARTLRGITPPSFFLFSFWRTPVPETLIVGRWAFYFRFFFFLPKSCRRTRCGPFDFFSLLFLLSFSFYSLHWNACVFF